MDCQTFREQIAELILPGGDPKTVGPMQAHAKSCPACAQYLAEMNRTLNAIQPSTEIKATAGFKERVMNKITEMEERESRPQRHWGWRFAMAAAVLIVFGLVMFKGSTTTNNGSAWAMEKTIEAYRGLRFIHIKSEPAEFGHVSDIYLKVDEQGKPRRIRLEFPDTDDGPKVVVWQDDKAEIWFKKKNSVAVVREPNMLRQLQMTVNDFDPRLLVESLHAKRADGKIEMKIEDSRTSTGLRISVSRMNSPIREVYTIDPSTQLLQEIEKFETKEGKEISLGRSIYLDYNKPDMDGVFRIEAPADAIRVDQANKDVGMAKGTLSEDEAAQKIAREFFEALIAENWDRVGNLWGGINGVGAKTMLAASGIKFVKIVSMGKPFPNPNRGTKGIQVPFEIEIEKNGKRSVEQCEIGARPVYGRPDRWNIFTGIKFKNDDLAK